MGDSLEQELDFDLEKTISLACEWAKEGNQKGQIDYNSQIELSSHERLDAIRNDITTKTFNRLISLLKLNDELVSQETSEKDTPVSTDERVEDILQSNSPQVSNNLTMDEDKIKLKFSRSCTLLKNTPPPSRTRKERQLIRRSGPVMGSERTVHHLQGFRENRASRLRYDVINTYKIERRKTCEPIFLRNLIGY
ncbi:unnamed protein product [Auanema sp. JU1783]|nr:unnamed protein product [Auanema sp. JU1783]